MSNNTNNNDNAASIESLNSEEFFKLRGDVKINGEFTVNEMYEKFKEQILKDLECRAVGFSKYVLAEKSK
jgi:hypothetical protein